MTATLSINSLIYGTVVLGPTSAQGQATNVGLILGSSNVIDLVARYRTYTQASQVASDFGSSAPEAIAATRYFGQAPQPATLLIGRWAETPASGQLIGATLSAAQQTITLWQAVTNGGVDFTIDGVAHNLASLDFSGVTSLNGVAAIITTALASAGTMVWDSSFQRFNLTSATTGTSSTVAFATAGAGTDISSMLGMRSTNSGAYVAAGASAESALACVQLFDNLIGQKFYGLATLGAADSDYVAIAEYLEASSNLHMQFITSSEAGMLVASDTTNIAYQLKQISGLNHSYVQYSSTDAYAAIATMSRAINIDYSGTNTDSILMYKQNTGVTPEQINATQLAALIGFNANVFTEYNNGAAILQNGVVSSGNFVDLVTGADAFKIATQLALFNELYTTLTKVPQTDAGMTTLHGAATGVGEQFRTCGFLGPGQWNNPGIGTLNQGDFLPLGYYVYMPPISSQSQADRAARNSVPITICAKTAGGVQTIQFTILVNL